jgi:hypothetical protein
MPLARRSSRTAPNLLPPTFPRRVRFFRRSYDNDRLSQNCAAFTVRLPGSRCETGILKTVEFLTNLDESESIVPDCVHLSTTVLAGHARTTSRTCVSRPGTCNRATARYTKAKNSLPALQSSFRSPTPRLTYIRQYGLKRLIHRRLQTNVNELRKRASLLPHRNCPVACLLRLRLWLG